jgi:hypothetical protein
MPDDESKQELIGHIRGERARLTEMLARFDNAKLLAATRNDGWTAKDILAHLTAWEERLLRWIQRWREHGEPGRPEIGVSWDEFDALNDQDHLASKNTALPNVRKASARAYEAVIRGVGDMTDEELAVRPETPDGPSWSWIVGANTYEHYQEHRAEMAAWWKKENA